MDINAQLAIMQRYHDYVRIQRRAKPDVDMFEEAPWRDLPRRAMSADDEAFDFRHYEYREAPADATWWGVYDTQTEQLVSPWCGSAAAAANKSIELNEDAAMQRYKPVRVDITDVTAR